MAEIVFFGALRYAVEADEGPRSHGDYAEYALPPSSAVRKARRKILKIGSSQYYECDDAYAAYKSQCDCGLEPRRFLYVIVPLFRIALCDCMSCSYGSCC